MTMSLDIPQGERGRLRLFHLEMGAEELRFLSEEGAIRDVLGVGASSKFLRGEVDSGGIRGAMWTQNVVNRMILVRFQIFGEVLQSRPVDTSYCK